MTIIQRATRLILLFIFILFFTNKNQAQGPGLVISEFMTNPSGNDSPFEYVELVATRSIDFSTTPYSVVFTNNGTATTAGWINGGNITYGFEINTGTVVRGDVVYVGGSSMAPLGTKVRVINTATTGGDGFGNFVTGGVLGNGGGNADGIAVFSSAVTSLTNSTVPVDCIFFGTGLGSAVVNGGLDGYQLPVNDNYSGGKLQPASFFAADPGSGTTYASGIFNNTSGNFDLNRTWSVGALTDGTTSIQQTALVPPATISFSLSNSTVNENAGTIGVSVAISGSNSFSSSVTVNVNAISNATNTVDYTIASSTVTFPPNSTGTLPFNIQLNDDVTLESDEYLVLSFSSPVNATTSGTTNHVLYIKDNDNSAPVGTNELVLNLLTSFSNGAEGTNSAEIVVHDPTTQRLYIANSIGKKLDIINFSNPASPTLLNSINITPYGNINSVDVRNGIVACAVENTNPQDTGFVVFFDGDGNFLKQVKVGMMPDMIAFNHAGTKVMTANEGEPNNAYTIDPNGSISVINISGGIPGLTQSNVTQIEFTAFNGQEALLRSQGIRIYGPGATTSTNFEPEYITISDDDQTAWVTLQENNAVAVLDLATNTITAIVPLGYKDYNTVSNALDFSDQTSGINLSNIPVKGMYLPDALTHFTIGATTYIMTANEGDARAYSGFSEEFRVSGLTLDPTAFPNGADLKRNTLAGRLRVTNQLGDTDSDGDFDELYSFGARSFSIWNATTGTLVYDSGDKLERITAADPILSALFNASNGGSPTPKDRSDDKGPEPEGVGTAVIDGHTYAFVSLERIGGVLIFNIDNPSSPVFVTYQNNRSFATNGPDRGAEGMIYISQANSPTGQSLLILANEISSTLTVFGLQTCTSLLNTNVTADGPLTFCAGDSVKLSAPLVANSSYQWLKNNLPVSGENDTLILSTTAGNYALEITSTLYGCKDTSSIQAVVVNANPTVVASSTSTSICSGNPITLSGGGANSYTWNNGASDGVAFVPASTQTYTVTGTAVNGCTDTDQITVTVKTTPSVSYTSTATTICNGTPVTLSGTGAFLYSWNNGVVNGTPFSPSSTQMYTVTGTAANGCTDTDQVTITVNQNPVVSANSTSNPVCSGNPITLSGSGAVNYNWDNGVSNGIAFVPSSSGMYTVTGTDNNNCVGTSSINIIVITSPVVSANTTDNAVCAGQSITLTGSGAQSYSWNLSVTDGVAFIPGSSQTYIVTGTASNNCTDTASVLITVNQLPNVTANVTDDEICQGDAIILTGSGAGSYTWNNGASNGISFVPASSQTYTVTGTDNNGCVNTDAISITVHTLPAAPTINSDLDTLTSSTASTYQWYFNGNPIPGASNQDYIVTQNGSYTVEITDANGCTSMSSVFTMNNVSVLESTENFRVDVYPNPFAGMTNLRILNNVENICDVTVLDAIGRIIYTTQLSLVKGENNHKLNLTESGVYFVRVEIAGETKTIRIIHTR